MPAPARWLRLVVLSVLAGCLAILLVATRHWPLISDTVLMHYVVFLMQQGMAPYRQIIDINMPGSYLVDAGVGHVLGAGAAGWRFFDELLMLAAGAAMVASLQRGRRFGALWAAAIFALLHIADGVAQEGQRDFVLAILLLAGYACVLRAVTSGRSTLFFFFGLCCGAASTIKPQAALMVLLALPAALALRRREAWRAAPNLIALLLAAVCGFLLLPTAVCGWLVHRGSLGACLHTMRTLDVYHAGMARHPLVFLLAHAFPSQLLAVAVLSGILLVLQGGWRRIDQGLLLAGVAFGFLSFVLQGKAYPYHRYPLLAVLLLLVATQLGEAFRPEDGDQGKRPRLNKGAQRTVAWMIVGYGALWLAPASTAKGLRYDWRDQPSLVQLQTDLHLLAGAPGNAALHGQVQCMDTMAGCITVLDRMQIVQATGFLYDCYFFAPGAGPVQGALRDQFLAQVEQKPPFIFVVTEQWCFNLPGGYHKLQQWPQFAGFLYAHYALAQQRAWTQGNFRNRATWPFGYRIYVRRPGK